MEAVHRLRTGAAPRDVARFVAARRDDLAVDAGERLLAAGQAAGARLVVPEDDEWPAAVFEALRWVDSGDEPSMPPLALWVRGDPPLAQVCARSVAIVGARAATAYGAHVAAEIAFGLAERDWTVVSGGAYGIDGAAHRGALAAGGRTVAALACGVDRPYPLGHSGLFERIADRGLLISEWPPGSSPQRMRFLVRNRVIAAMSRGTVVVEAAARSGARQTARRAAELSRIVLAVPGPVTSAMSVGPHELIRDQIAGLVTSAQQVVDALSSFEETVEAVSGRSAEDEPGQAPDDAPPAELAEVLEGVPRRGIGTTEEIARRAGTGLVDTLRALPRLAEDGWVIQVSTGYRLGARRRHRPSRSASSVR